MLISSSNSFAAEAYYDYKDDLQLLADVEAIEAQVLAQETMAQEALTQEAKKEMREDAQRRAESREASGLKSLFKCSYCAEDFSGKVQASHRLVMHINKSHPGKNPCFQCPVCEKTFAKAKQLIVHTKKHE